jgi:hypothetical protein
MRRPPMVLRLASASAMLLVGCESGQPLEPFMTSEDIAAARMTGGPQVAAPSNALATAYSTTQIDVSWRDNSSNEKSFQIYRSLTGETGTFTWLAYTAANTTTYRNQGLEPGVRYCYAVLAEGVIGKKTITSVFSNTVCATTTSPPVAAPSNAAAVASSSNRIEIQWQDNSTNETHFEIHRSVYPQRDVFSLLTVTGENAVSYSDQGLSPSIEYCYKIRAVQVIGDQVIVWPFSNITCAWTLPNAASSTTATPNNSYAVLVDWTAIGIYFRIERSTDGGVVWNTAGTAENTRSFWDNVEPEQAVCYRVVTYNTSGDAPPSNSDCTTPPAAPTDVTWSTVDASTVELSWKDNSSVEDGYEVRGMYPDCFRDWDGVEYCYGYVEYAIAVLPANTTRFRGPGT